MIKKGWLLLFLFVVTTTFTFAQRKRGPVWTFNTKNTTINGLSVGLITTQRIDSVTTNGMRFELLGLGVFIPLMPESPISENEQDHEAWKSYRSSERINGLNLSPLGAGCNCSVNGLNLYGFGSITDRVNGISTGLVMNVTEVHNGIQLVGIINMVYDMNGIQIAFFQNDVRRKATGLQVAALNRAEDLRGIQVGLFNKTVKIRGLQIGLWNVNEKRKMILLNF